MQAYGQAYGLWALGGIVVLLALFFLLRGRIGIEQGWAGWTLARFGAIERLAHWLLALSFIVLALTGLNTLYGRSILQPLVGAPKFAEIALWSGWLHTCAAFVFMPALVVGFVAWLRHSLPSWRDIVWLAMGGGLLARGLHPPARKLDAGQKIFFWLVMLGGLSLSLSGLALMSPGETVLLSRTFDAVNALGGYIGLAPGLPTQLTRLQEMQYATAWHDLAALGLGVVVIAHVYLRTLGMEGAFSAMASGQVDANWARQHHSLWAKREIEKMEKAAAETGAARAAATE